MGDAMPPCPPGGLPDVLLRLVVLLGQVLGRGLAGDFHHGELLAVAGHVAGHLTDAVLVVLLHQEIWAGRERDEEREKPNTQPPSRGAGRPYLKPGLRTPCTAPGCSKGHRLEERERIPMGPCPRAEGLDPAARGSPGMCTMRQLQFSTR